MAAATRAHLVRFALLVVVVVVLNFLLPRLLPGSPLSTAAAESAAAFLPAAAQAELRRSYGVDRPLPAQFTAYLGGLARGSLGRSLATHRPVTQMIGERLPWTFLLVGVAVVVAAVVGAGLGTAAAFRPDGRVRLLGPLVIGLGALPEFLVAMVLIVVLGVGLPLFPAGGAMTPFLTQGWIAAIRDIVWHAALPALTLIVGLVPAFFLTSRNTLVAVLGEPFLLTARGKGLSGRGVLRHAWVATLTPVLTLLGLRLAFVVTGAAVVERIFAYPGMGMLLFEAVVRRDYPVLQGIFLIASLVILCVNLTLDLAAAALDPRVRRAQA